jgi:hypothetical protein
MTKKWIGILLAAAGLAQAAGVAPEITLSFVGTPQASSFPKQIYINVVNPGYTPFDLAKEMRAAIITVDGKPSKWVGKSYDGPAGIQPVGEWDGCLRVEDFSPPLTPGSHQVTFKLGTGTSAPGKLRWHAPVNWRKGNMKSRLKEVQALAAVLVDGLPKSCVENWLTVKDGGFVEGDRVRYFLEPDIKVVIPYRQTFVSGRERTVVDGTPQIYQEPQNPD